ncbi:MAG TPA: hypothetical protein VEC38_01045 [Candidatus Binataceae bacterium]|nr:hypothetical protein [Candidatus Binataceae bacterium]
MAWETKRVLITIRTYPVPSFKSLETSCTGGITQDGKWIRLFPMPYRRLRREQQFSKYQWIEARVQKAQNDARPESFNPDRESIRPVSGVLPSDNQWAERKKWVFPLKAASLCALQKARNANGFPTLGFFKPLEIGRLKIEPDEEDWTPAQRQALTQADLFDAAPREELEKIPFKFSYEFSCADPGCGGHDLSCTDWEMSESYRKWRQEYGDGWEAPFRQKYEREMIQRFDTHFYVGTVHQHPDAWIIVGLFYPLPVRQPSLF